jgi:hypothetical protein
LNPPRLQRPEGGNVFYYGWPLCRKGRVMRPAAFSAALRAVRAKLSLEQRRNIEQILDAIQTVRSPEALRHLRAVEVLERIGGAEAREVLKNLATGMSEARSTQEAQASLKRLARRPTTLP